jgi:hypothetical protein
MDADERERLRAARRAFLVARGVAPRRAAMEQEESNG